MTDNANRGRLPDVHLHNIPMGNQKMNAELSTGDATFIGSATQRYINFTIAYICPALLGVLSILIVLDKFWGITIILITL